ncbi:tyrosine-type recombinase/integrase [Marinicellulosiphila megalodicopiae]|uniref:tyrosine-type recombinase/integrase n=1 Tax=Marinicellulosiphila megalodicopiae TaxID=2724896 RepID=UPI003BB07920
MTKTFYINNDTAGPNLINFFNLMDAPSDVPNFEDFKSVLINVFDVLIEKSTSNSEHILLLKEELVAINISGYINAKKVIVKNSVVYDAFFYTLEFLTKGAKVSQEDVYIALLSHLIFPCIYIDEIQSETTKLFNAKRRENFAELLRRLRTTTNSLEGKLLLTECSKKSDGSLSCIELCELLNNIKKKSNDKDIKSWAINFIDLVSINQYLMGKKLTPSIAPKFDDKSKNQTPKKRSNNDFTPQRKAPNNAEEISQIIVDNGSNTSSHTPNDDGNSKTTSKRDFSVFKGGNLLEPIQLFQPDCHRHTLPLAYAKLLFDYLVEDPTKEKLAILVSLLTGVDIRDYDKLYFVSSIVEIPANTYENAYICMDRYFVHYSKLGKSYSRVLRCVPWEFIDLLQCHLNTDLQKSLSDQLNIEQKQLNNEIAKISLKIDRFPTLSTIRDYQFYRHLHLFKDEIFSYHVTPFHRFQIHDGIYYASFENKHIYKRSQQVMNELTEFNTSVELSDHLNSIVGSKKNNDTKQVSEWISKLRGELNTKAKQIKNASDLSEYHLEYSLFTIMQLSLISGHRPVNSMFARRIDFIEDNALFICDKIVDASHVSRVVALPDITTKIRKAYDNHLDNLTARIGLIKKDLADEIRSSMNLEFCNIPQFFMFDNTFNICEIPKKKVDEYFARVSVASNISRHILSSYLIKEGLDRLYVNFQLGHYSNDTGPISEFSPLSIEQLTLIIKPILNKFVKDISLRATVGCRANQSILEVSSNQTKHIPFNKKFGPKLRLSLYKKKEKERKLNLKIILNSNNITNKQQPKASQVKKCFDNCSNYDNQHRLSISLKKLLKRFSNQRGWNLDLPTLGYEASSRTRSLISLNSSYFVQNYVIIEEAINRIDNIEKIKSTAQAWSFIYISALVHGIKEIDITSFKKMILKRPEIIENNVFFESKKFRWSPSEGWLLHYYYLYPLLVDVSLEQISNSIRTWLHYQSKFVNLNLPRSIKELKQTVSNGILYRKSGMYQSYLKGTTIKDVKTIGWIRQFSKQCLFENNEFNQSEHNQSKPLESVENILAQDNLVFFLKVKEINRLKIEDVDKKNKLRDVFEEFKANKRSYWPSVFSYWGLELLQNGTVQTKSIGRIITYLLFHYKNITEVFQFKAISNLNAESIEDGYEDILQRSKLNDSSLILREFHKFYKKEFYCVDINFDFNTASISKDVKIDTLFTSQIKILQEKFKNSSVFTAFTLLLCETGMRSNELINLSKQDIDFENELIHIRYNKLKKVKTTQSNRFINFENLTTKCIQSLKEISLINGPPSKKITPFFSIMGKEIEPLLINFTNQCSLFLACNVHLHMFRHYAITKKIAMAKTPKDIWETSSFFGHKSPLITLKTYSHGVFDKVVYHKISDKKIAFLLKVNEPLIRQWRRRDKNVNPDLSSLDLFIRCFDNWHESKYKDIQFNNSISNFELKFDLISAIKVNELINKAYSVDLIHHITGFSLELLTNFIKFMKNNSATTKININFNISKSIYTPVLRNLTELSDRELKELRSIWQLCLRKDGKWHFESIDHSIEFIQYIQKIHSDEPRFIIFQPRAFTDNEIKKWSKNLNCEIRKIGGEKSLYNNVRPRSAIQVETEVTPVFSVDTLKELNFLILLFFSHKESIGSI